MLRFAANNPDAVIRSLYDLYPDFNIDVEAEQKAVEQADLLVLQHPMYWYSYPPLLKLWIDKVFTQGWAYGASATALKNKNLLWAVTTGGEHDHFEGGDHPGLAVLSQPLQATANYCAMNWLRPVAIHGAYRADQTALLAELALSIAKIVGAIVAVVLLGQYVSRPVLRFVARSGLREIFSAVALFLVFGFGLLLEEAGLSMAMGAFLAGVLLASSEYRHALESDIEPFKGLLLGLFFIGVGMSIDFGTLIDAPLKVITLTLGFILIKLLVIKLLGRFLNVPSDQRSWQAVFLGQGSEFAFVVFGAATVAGILVDPWGKSLTLAVALSMCVTPLLILLLNHLELSSKQGSKEADTIDQSNPRVIIAGFGRFGQIAGRLLMSCGFEVVVLDHDPDHIETLRKFGVKVFYGDATRLDLLHAAGAAQAVVLINAIDNQQDNLALTALAQEHFPSLKLVVRARDMGHIITLRQMGIEDVERETFESALSLGRRALEQLGIGRYEARERAHRFRRLNLEMLEEMAAQPEEDTEFKYDAYKRANALLTEIFNEDRAHPIEAGPGKVSLPRSESGS